MEACRSMAWLSRRLKSNLHLQQVAILSKTETSMRAGPKGDGLCPNAPASRQDASPRLPRRDFLFALGVAGSGAAAMAPRAFTAPGKAPMDDTVAPSSRYGY